MHLLDTLVHYFGIKFINLGYSNFCHSIIKKSKTVQRIFILQCSQNMLFISDTKYYVPFKLCRMPGNILLFKITGMLTPKNVNLKQNFIWDVME